MKFRDNDIIILYNLTEQKEPLVLFKISGSYITVIEHLNFDSDIKELWPIGQISQLAEYAIVRDVMHVDYYRTFVNKYIDVNT